jgi:CelD/BcsL family acetyltransferase involved in cellulose biosynthesis
MRVTGNLRFVARALDVRSASAPVIAEWQELASRALEGNCFLAPWFLMPAARYLDPAEPLTLLLVDAYYGSVKAGLAAMACVRPAPRERSLPWRHLAAYRPLHAYTSGALVDPRWPEDSIRCLLEASKGIAPATGALRLSNVRCDGPLARAARSAIAGSRFGWFPTRRAHRAALRTSRLPASGAASRIDGAALLDDGPGLPREIRRALRRLAAAAGPVEFRILRGRNLDDAAVERHLELESAGWKGSSRGAMLSDPRSAAFFREVVAGAAACDEAFLCELLAGGQVIASTSNFIGARQGFAFKLGWDPRHARSSPGLLVDHALARYAPLMLRDLDLVDGCADPGSHLERIWEGKIEVADGYVAWGLRERTILEAIAAARRVRDRFRGPQRNGSATD